MSGIEVATAIQLAIGGLGALSACLAAGASIIGAWHSWRNAMAIQSIHIDINSRLSELLKATSAAAYDSGAEHGRTTANAETDARTDRLTSPPAVPQ